MFDIYFSIHRSYSAIMCSIFNDFGSNFLFSVPELLAIRMSIGRGPERMDYCRRHRTLRR